ncbi:MAG: hypothetical protein CVV51_13685 [Spirochaetae bacterium HGW-Spirochaetae-7]|jgi:hypothetical protein|nr:MAG: hypothetical protein CVV51_13685 [Spirochaetae bacterium HGW-Spirochaetae-7]
MKLQLTMPDDLVEKIRAAGRRDLRSISLEIVHLVKLGFREELFMSGASQHCRLVLFKPAVEVDEIATGDKVSSIGEKISREGVHHDSTARVRGDKKAASAIE